MLRVSYRDIPRKRKMTLSLTLLQGDEGDTAAAKQVGVMSSAASATCMHAMHWFK